VIKTLMLAKISGFMCKKIQPLRTHEIHFSDFTFIKLFWRKKCEYHKSVTETMSAQEDITDISYKIMATSVNSCTPCPEKKLWHFIFCSNLAKCWSILTILSLTILNSKLHIPPHLNCVTTLPCEMFVLKIAILQY